MLTVTRQSDIARANSYDAEGFFLDPSVDDSDTTRRICDLASLDDADGKAAVRRIARQIAKLRLNAAPVLLKLEDDCLSDVVEQIDAAVLPGRELKYTCNERRQAQNEKTQPPGRQKVAFLEIW